MDKLADAFLIVVLGSVALVAVAGVIAITVALIRLW